MQAKALIDYLRQHFPDLRLSGPPVPLQGGLLNYVWRVPALPRSIIAKYTPPYIASAPQIAIDASRSKFEAAALRWWDEQKDSNNAIRPPHLLHAFGERSLILMEDVGPAADLAIALKQMDLPTATATGKLIGQFIAHLHQNTLQDPYLARHFQNEGVQSVRLAVQYNLLPALQKAQIPQAQAIADRITEVGQWIDQAGICLIMGDLWPPSILISDAGPRVIDWEFTHFGWPIQDVAHLSAHLWMQTHMAENAAHREAVQNCLFSFLETYFTAFGERLAPLEPRRLYFVHVGAEILARTIGDFQAGYVYDGLALRDSRMQEAIDFAIESILSPATDSFFGPFFVI